MTTTPTKDDLAAGREFDALVAEKVMGWRRVLYAGRFYWFGPYDGRIHRRMDYEGASIGNDVALAFAENDDPERFAPSTDIAAAWQIVDYMDSLGWKVQVRSDSQLEGYEAGGPWVCVFVSRDGAPWAAADTAPLAICRAALAALSPSPPG